MIHLSPPSHIEVSPSCPEISQVLTISQNRKHTYHNIITPMTPSISLEHEVSSSNLQPKYAQLTEF